MSGNPVCQPTGHRDVSVGTGLVSALLAYAARPFSVSSCPRASEIRWDRVDELQLRHVLEAGQGAMLFHAAKDSIDEAPPEWRDVLEGADLTARVTHGNRSDAMAEILDDCAAAGIPVTLLKGISVADELYPAAHLRPMGDIDFLVPEDQREAVESRMVRRGYVRKAGYLADDGDPHRAPLFHAGRDVWAEVHTALFPNGDRLLRDTLFSDAQIGRESEPSTFQGRPVFRLTRALQLAYVSSYWIRDLAQNPVHPTFVAPMIDAIYLVKGGIPGMESDRLPDWLDNEMAIASVYLTLTCIARYGFDRVLSPLRSLLRSHQQIIGAPEERIIASMIGVCLVGGRPFLGRFGARHPMIGRSIFYSLLEPGAHVGKVLALPLRVLFPPWIADRYSVRYQIGRVRRFLRT